MLKTFESPELLQIMERIDREFWIYWLPTVIIGMLLVRYFLRRSDQSQRPKPAEPPAKQWSYRPPQRNIF